MLFMPLRSAAFAHILLRKIRVLRDASLSWQNYAFRCQLLLQELPCLIYSAFAYRLHPVLFMITDKHAQTSGLCERRVTEHKGLGAIDTRIGRMRSFSRLAKRGEHEGPVADREQHASS